MHPRIQELLDFLDRERGLLRQAVAAIPRELHERAPAEGRWTVAQILEHLTYVEGAIGRLIRKQVAEAAEHGRETEFTSVVGTLDLARMADRGRKISAPEFLLPRGELDSEASLARLEELRAETHQTLAAADGLPLGKVSAPHPALGMLNGYQWVLALGGHEGRHRAQIEDIGHALSGATGTS
ncbi:MAG TPA: DinB family protein [Longimicrobiaceae bacterium]|nr:DinB family protein [Longimicrobiaceae bacterium]